MLLVVAFKNFQRQVKTGPYPNFFESSENLEKQSAERNDGTMIGDNLIAFLIRKLLCPAYKLLSPDAHNLVVGNRSSP